MTSIYRGIFGIGRSVFPFLLNHLKSGTVTLSSSDSHPAPLFRSRSMISLYRFFSAFILLRHCLHECSYPAFCSSSSVLRKGASLRMAPSMPGSSPCSRHPAASEFHHTHSRLQSAMFLRVRPTCNPRTKGGRTHLSKLGWTHFALPVWKVQSGFNPGSPYFNVLRLPFVPQPYTLSLFGCPSVAFPIPTL